MKSFKQNIITVVKSIPRGSTMSYGQVAEVAGFPAAARAVGTIMASNTDIQIPCHRVIRSDGGFGPYNGLRGKSKQELLKEEGAI